MEGRFLSEDGMVMRGRLAEGECTSPSYTPFAYLLLNLNFIFLRILFFYSDTGEGREKERERNIDVREKHRSVASHIHTNRGLTHNPGTCPDQESNR